MNPDIVDEFDRLARELALAHENARAAEQRAEAAEAKCASLIKQELGVAGECCHQEEQREELLARAEAAEQRLATLAEAARELLDWCGIQTNLRKSVEKPYSKLSAALAGTDTGELGKLRAVAEAARNVRKWGVEFDDERIKYISVQVDREDVAALDAALAALEVKP